jgi:ribosomal protein S7
MRLKNSVYGKFVGILMKKGKKLQSKRILDGAFQQVGLRLGISVESIIMQLLLKLNTFVELRKIRFRRSSHDVPFAVDSNRGLYLVVRWLLESVKEDKRHLSTKEKLVFEILNTLTTSNSKTLRKKESNFLSSIKSRSNSHFRW